MLKVALVCFGAAFAVTIAVQSGSAQTVATKPKPAGSKKIAPATAHGIKGAAPHFALAQASSDGMLNAAEEFVRTSMPMDAQRTADARAGQWQPPCVMQYPPVGSANHPAAPGYVVRMNHAVDGAAIEQNLVAAGLPLSTARYYVDLHLREMDEFDALSPEQQDALDKAQNSPKWRFSGYLNRIVDPPGLPHFKDVRRCSHSAYLSYMTPYRFILAPANGSIFIISRFSFRVCQLSKVDPYDQNLCQDWIEVGDGEDTKLLGDYVYSAVWPGGRHHQAIRNFAYDGKDVHFVTVQPDAK